VCKKKGVKNKTTEKSKRTDGWEKKMKKIPLKEDVME